MPKNKYVDNDQIIFIVHWHIHNKIILNITIEINLKADDKHLTKYADMHIIALRN